LNTVVSNTLTGSNLSSGSIVLPAGVYEIEADAICYGTDYTRLRLFNTDTNSVILYGLSGFARGVSSSHSVPTKLTGIFTLTASNSILRLQQFSSGGSGGIPVQDGSPEIYVSVMLKWLGPN
jgi:hypothetical protein